MKSQFRFLASAVGIAFITLSMQNITFASPTADSGSCLDISPTNPLTELDVFAPPDPETIVSQLAWSPDGRHLSASYVDKPVTDRSERIHLWDLATGENTVVFSRLDEPYAVTGSWSTWSPDSSRLALNSDGTVRIVTIADGNVVSLEDNPIGLARLVWSPDSSQLATIEGTTEGRYVIHVWDADTGQQERELEVHGFIPNFRGTWTDRGLRWLTQDEERTVHVWEAGRDQPRFTLSPSYYPSSLWLSPSGNYLVSSRSASRVAQIWNVNEGQLVQTLNTSVIDVIWTSDEACVATATFNDPLYLSSRPEIWNLATGELLQSIETRMNGVNSLAWSPDGTALAYLDATGSIHVWGLR